GALKDVLKLEQETDQDMVIGDDISDGEDDGSRLAFGWDSTPRMLYIAQSGNMWLGGGTLYLYALGMGLPLILVTVFGNRLLPKSG
ncbi:hypothetical protein MJI95_36960, partial [Salmonella enterica subsp. enterica serovar Kentucky]|nr:hypothetical protein [Salmonella enterica subsp. enterica serovar Kentucky]